MTASHQHNEDHADNVHHWHEHVYRHFETSLTLPTFVSFQAGGVLATGTHRWHCRGSDLSSVPYAAVYSMPVMQCFFASLM